MKCLVFSDTHGNSINMKLALSYHKDAEAVFFLGDGLRDAEELYSEFRDKTWFLVRGNCDFRDSVLGTPVPKTDEVTLEGKKIVFTHGDMYNVKYTDTSLDSLAVSRQADIVLYGHTHRATEDFRALGERSVYFFNPGTAGGIDRRASYGILNIDEKNVLFSIANVAIC